MWNCFGVIVNTCSLSYEWAQFGAEENIHMVEDKLDHNRLYSHLHECCSATEAGRFDLFWP